MSEGAQQPVANTGFNRPAIDEQVLASLQRDLSEAMMPEVIQAFRTEVDQRVKDVAQALSNRDWNSASRHAHALKGTAATLGASGLIDLAIAIEHAGRAGDLAALQKQFQQLQYQVQRITEDLNQRYPSAGCP
ncbi:Hpt domain-containing protein [Halochromatium sp.]